MSAPFASDATLWPERAIICVTGGNSGVGFGICKRLIDQLSNPPVSDLQNAFPTSAQAPDSPFTTPRGLTLVLACRNAMKAHKACTELLEYAGKRRPKNALRSAKWKYERRERILSNSMEEEEVASLLKRKRHLTPTQYRQMWLSNLRIEFVPLDLSSYASTMNCAQELTTRYPYISHLMLNAGCGPFRALDWIGMFKSLARNVITTITYPTYIIEEQGIITDDGLGWTWQCNVFGHYALACEVLDSLAAAPFESPRIIWTCSIDGLPEYYDAQDRYALQSKGSYQSTKFQGALLGWAFNQHLEGRSEGIRRIKSFPVHPGVVAGNMFYDVVGYLLDRAMYCVFLMARMLGSHHHVVDPYKAAMPFIYVALAPLALLYTHLTIAQSTVSRNRNGGESWHPARFGARATPGGRPYVAVDIILPPSDAKGLETYYPIERRKWFDPAADVIRRERWWWNKEMANDLLAHCEAVREKLHEQYKVSH